MIVVDTNIIAYLIINGEFTSQAECVLEKDPRWASPMLWHSELSNILTGCIRRGSVTLSKAQELMSFALDVIGRGTIDVSPIAVLNLAARSACSSYDCEFVALAQSLGIPLVTNDKQILKEFPGIAVSLKEFMDRS
jgi:predicted nucleic acid-binding protein